MNKKIVLAFISAVILGFVILTSTIAKPPPLYLKELCRSDEPPKFIAYECQPLYPSNATCTCDGDIIIWNIK